MLLIKATKQFRLLKKTTQAREKRLYKIQVDKKKLTCLLIIITKIQTIRLIMIFILLILLNFRFYDSATDDDYNYDFPPSGRQRVHSQLPPLPVCRTLEMFELNFKFRI